MPKHDFSVNSLRHSSFTNDSNDNSSIIQVSDTPTTDNDGWVHARKFFVNNGSIDIAVNGSVTPVVFELDIQPNEVYVIYRLEFVFTDNGNINQLSDFMSIAGGLPNGLVLEATLANPSPIVTVKTNYGLINRLRSQIEIKNIGNDSVAVGDQYFARPVIVDGSLGHNMKATVNDDMSSLLLSTISATGVVKELS